MNTLVRTQISIPHDQKQAADQIASWKNVSMAEIFRQALADYISKEKQKRAERRAVFERLAGSWANSPNWKGVNGSAYQRQIRREKGI